MASFNININAQLITPYNGITRLYNKGENCDGFVETYNVGLASAGSVVGTDAYLLFNPSGQTYETLYIDDIVYVDDTKMWIEYNGVKLLPNTEYTIDVTGINNGDYIPLLFVKTNQPATDYFTQNIKLSLALEDTVNKYDYKTTNIKNQFAECLTLQDITVSEEIRAVYNPCSGEYQAFTVAAPSNYPLYFQYQVLDNGARGTIGGLDRLDASDGNVINTEIGPFSAVENQLYTHIINNDLSGNYYFRFRLCANPPTQGSSTVSVELRLMNLTNDSIVESYILIASI